MTDSNALSSLQFKKSIHENFAQFFEKPTRDKLRLILSENVGEFDHLDFKATYIESSKLAKIILGIANSGGGCIIFGVEDSTLDPVGIPEIRDKSDIVKSIQNYIPENLLKELSIIDFIYKKSEFNELNSKVFQVIIVDSRKNDLPYVSEADGTTLSKAQIYVRRGFATEKANYDEIQNLLSIRIETQYSSNVETSLEQHISQLKILYESLDKGYYHTNLLLKLPKLLSFEFERKFVANANYPEETLEKFIARMIEKKKRGIENLLD